MNKQDVENNQENKYENKSYPNESPKSTNTVLNNILISLDNDIEDIDNVINDGAQTDKDKLTRIMTKRIEKLKIRSNILRFKYTDYKQYYDGTNIGIIVLSTCLTLIESYKNILNIREEPEGTQQVFAILPITLSSIIGLSASVLKFKKYQHKMESIMKCIEQCNAISLKIKSCLDELLLKPDKQTTEKILNQYLREINPAYLKCERAINMNLRYNDLVKHMSTFQNLNLQYQKSNSHYIYNKKKIQLIEQLKENGIKDEIEDEHDYSSCWYWWICCRRRNNRVINDIEMGP